MTIVRRLPALTGLGGIILVVAGLATDAAPTASWPAARIDAWYAGHGLGAWLLSGYLLAAAAPLIMMFTAELRRRLADQGAGDRTLSLVLGAGVALAVTLLTGAGLYVAVPAAMTFTHAPQPSADTSRYFLGAAYGVLVMFSAFAAALLAGAVSVASLRHPVLPRWLAIAGIPASVLMLANALMPMAVITLWFVATSVALALRSAVPGATRHVAVTPAPAPA